MLKLKVANPYLKQQLNQVLKRNAGKSRINESMN